MEFRGCTDNHRIDIRRGGRLQPISGRLGRGWAGELLRTTFVHIYYHPHTTIGATLNDTCADSPNISGTDYGNSQHCLTVGNAAKSARVGIHDVRNTTVQDAPIVV